MVRARRGRLDGGAGGRRPGHPHGSHDPAASTCERDSACQAPRSRPRVQPNGCAVLASRAAPAIQGCGSALRNSADGGLAETGRRGASPLPPQAPRPLSVCSPPGATPPGTRQVGRSSAAAAATGVPRIVARPPPASASPKPGAPSLGRIAGDPGDRGRHGAGGKTVRRRREPPGGAAHLPPPRAPPRGWGFGGCSREKH
ncbi:Nipped-B-Like Protein [Manis pentadactyla]|nr:Nipped-B-Like Protein [Manis pentadactyla]